MDIIEIDETFEKNLMFQPYHKRAIVLSLTDRIKAAPSIDKLKPVLRCPHSDECATYDRVCLVFFRLLRENKVGLANFWFKELS